MMPNEIFLTIGLVFNGLITFIAINNSVKQNMKEAVNLENRLTRIETILEEMLVKKK